MVSTICKIIHYFCSLAYFIIIKGISLLIAVLVNIIITICCLPFLKLKRGIKYICLYFIMRKRKLSTNVQESEAPSKPKVTKIFINGPSGLINDKLTCYMNSMIQAMASSEKLIKEYEEILDKTEKEGNYEKMTLFGDLLRNVNDSSKTAENNTKILKELMNLIEWNKTTQEDTFQLLSAVINSIQKDIKDDLLKANITMPPKFKLLHTFTESSDYNKVQDHLALALPLCGDFRNVPGVKLNTLMDAFFQPSPIDDGEYSTQMFFFERVPDVLILHIQANEWDDDQGTYIKPKYYIRYKDKMEYEFNIHLKKDGSEIMKVKEVYKLTAVVHHMGTISGGHYITYRTHEGVWYLTNDEQVEEVSFNFDKVPYVMVYEKLYM